MLIATGDRKVQTDTMKAYRKHTRKQYNNHQCQLGRVTPGNALLISVCILMLPMVQLSAEHVQLATKYHVNPINQWYVHQHHLNISNTPLVLPSLGNVLPAIVLQNDVVRLNISCPSYTSSHSSIHHNPPSLHLNLLHDLGRSVVAVVLTLLLLLSGDIETNPGPFGQQLSDNDLPVVMEELNKACVKWYDIGMMLRVSLDRLDTIKEQYSNHSACLRETLKIWLKTYPSHPTWSNIVDALRSYTVGEIKLATDLERKYCLTQDISVAATYHPLLVSASHMTTLPKFMASLSQPPVFAPPYSMPPQPHPSHIPPWSASHYSPPLASQPMSTQLLPPPSSGTAHTATPDPTPVPSSTLMTASPPYPVLPPSLPSLISGFTPPDTLPAPQPPTMTSSREHTGSLDKLFVKQQVKMLEKRFSNLVDCAYKALLENNAEDNVRYFRSSFLSLDVSRKREHHKFIHEQLMKMHKEATFDDIWEKLTDYWNFLNFDLLDYIVDKFDIEDLKQKMKSYEHDLQSFRKATRLCDFIDCWPVQGEAPPEAELREFVAKMGHRWDNCTLEDLESLKGVITRKFFLPEFALLLKQIKGGCVVITWLIPAPFVKPLQEAIKTTSNEFFMEQMIEAVTIDGQNCYPSTPTVSFTLPTLGETFLPVKPDVNGNETQSKLSTHLDDVSSLCSGHSSESSRSGYSNRTTSSGFSSRSATTGYSSESSSSGYSSGYSSVTFAPLFHHPTYHASQPTFGYSRPPLSFHHPTTAKKLVRKEHVDEISQQVKLLPSVEQYLSEAEIEADPSLPTKYKDYLSSTPAIRAALYTTFSAKMAAEVFNWTDHTESPPPTTMTELFAAFTLKTVVDHLTTHPMYHKQQLKVTTFNDLPVDVYKQFQDLCRMAYEGILNRQQLVFSAAHLPTGFAHLGLMQNVPQLYPEGRAFSYQFIHLTLQEYLAAVHISQLPTHEQKRLVREHVDSGHFKMTIRFWTGLTKLANIPPDITTRLMKSDKLNYFHFLFEANDVSVLTRAIDSGVIVISSHYSWTPLDYYVTGHAISCSNCSWSLDFWSTSINVEKFVLFCQGCATPGRTQCRGHISYANFGYNNITSESIQSFVNLPPHILQDMRELYLHHNKLDGDACDLLAKGMPSMSRLEELWLNDNAVGSGGAVEVIMALGGSGVKELSLSNTGIGEPDCEALCVLLKSLQRLYIHENNLSSESVASIIFGLSHNSSLKTLDISNSHFSMVNVHNMSSILRDQSKCTLTKLWLQDCQISGLGASQLAAGLTKSSNLKHLNLNHNPIGLEGAFSMSDMLQHKTSLEYLNLCDNSLGEDGVHQLISSLKHNQTLRELWLPVMYKIETSDERIHWGW